MAISEEQYQKLANHIVEECSPAEVRQILSGDFSPIKNLIVEELLLNDYQGTIIDIIFEDFCRSANYQKKKPLLRAQFSELADFLMTDVALYHLKYNLSKIVKK